MAGLLRNSIEEVLYSSPPQPTKPKHAEEAQAVCRSVGKLLKRFEKHSQGEELEVTIMSQAEECVGAETSQEADVLPLTRVEKSLGGFSFADSTQFNTIITPDDRHSELDKERDFPLTDDKENSLVETPILRSLPRQESGYEFFRSRCDTDSGRTSTPATPRRFADKPTSHRRLFDTPAPQPETESKLETTCTRKASPGNKSTVIEETPILRNKTTTSPGYQLYKELCKEDLEKTERLFKFLDFEPTRCDSGIHSSAPSTPKTIDSTRSSNTPATYPRTEITVTPMRPKPVQSKASLKPRPASLHSNSSEGSDYSSGTDSTSKTFSPTARKQVLAASTKFCKWESERKLISAQRPNPLFPVFRTPSMRHRIRAMSSQHP